MRGYKTAFILAAELGKVQAGRFYDDVADAYLKIYGYHTPFDGDLKEDHGVASDVDEEEDVDELPPNVAVERLLYYNEIRKVSRIEDVHAVKSGILIFELFQKIGYWFRTEYGGSVRTTKNKKAANFKTVFNQEALDPAAPARPRITSFYSARCYNERIKARFDARWAVVAAQVLPPGVKRPAAITVQNQVIKEAWEAETLPFQEEMQAALEAEHQAALDAHANVVAGEAPTTPEEYQLALNNAGYYLQPFIDAVAERFGMNVSLLMCGPTPDRGGAIEVHSVHSGSSKGMVPRIWPEYDRAGFEAMRRSFRQFSEHCYCERALLHDCRYSELTIFV
ncbi:hypothetical protein C8R46DRAFT_905183 [Mycena filopes]|nr:hypothetical protein C8R46DRAFT_905183 [Mycena filopes]